MRILFKTLFLFVLTSNLCCEVFLSDSPICILNGKEASLDKPEGLAFSPDGKILCVANSNNSSIAFFAKDASSFEKTARQIFQDRNTLKHPHDVAFSPCGTFLLVASRDSNSVISFKKNDTGTFQLSSSIANTSFMNMPSSVSFQAQDDLIAVCNRTGQTSIALYAKTKNNTYENIKALPSNALQKLELSTPHSIAFSPDGKLLAAVHKRVCKYVPGKSALVIWDIAEMKPAYISIQDFEPLHSVAFHPSGKYLAVTNEKKGVHIFEKRENTFVLTKTIKVRSALKGVAFSPCGTKIAFTTQEPSILIHSFKESGL